MTCSRVEETVNLEEWQRGKICHFKRTDNTQVERIWRRWRALEEKLHGIGGAGGGEGRRDTGWREDIGRWLVWSEPRVRPATSLRRFMDVDETLVSHAVPVSSVLAQVGACCPVWESFLMRFHFSFLPGWSDDSQTKSCHFESSLHILHSQLFVIQSLVTGWWRGSLKALGKYGVHQMSRYRFWMWHGQQDLKEKTTFPDKHQQQQKM